jgi:hypothetical protein
MGYNVTGLTSYVETNKEVLVKDAVLGSGIKGETLPLLRKQLGVKTKERLNYLDVNPVLQDGSACGFSAQGSTVLADRDVETSVIKYNDQWCWKDMLGKFAEYQVRINANEDGLPFEGEITDQIVKGINKQVETLIWQGDKSDGDLINGFLTIAEGADSASTIVVTAATGTSAYERIKAVYMAIPEEWIDEAVIFVSPALFREYVQNLVSANLYHYDPAFNGELTEMFVPGSDIKVRKAYGLTGSDRIYASVPDNMVYACDMLDAKEDFKMWYNDEDELVKVKVLFNAGVATLYPDAVVIGK